MKEQIIEMLKLELEETTKHNEIWKNKDCLVICNLVTGIIKIKPRH